MRLEKVLAVMALLGLCTSPSWAKVPEVPEKTPIEIDAFTETRPLKFQRIVMRLPRNQVIGQLQDGLLCIPWGEEITVRGGKSDLNYEFFNDVFRDELQANGYILVGDPDALFEDRDADQAEFLIAGLINDLKADLCYTSGSEDNYTKSKGKAYVKVDWQIFSQLERRVVYETTSEGSGATKGRARAGGDEDAIYAAFAAASRNLLADQGFFDLMTGGSAAASVAATPPSEVQHTIPDLGVSQGSFTDQVTDIRSQVATVFASGMGSGFYVADGLLLTNQHVVGGANFVKVKLVTGREIVGEVLSTNSARDVALIQTEKIGLPGLTLNTADQPVGSEVYVVGSPLDESLDSTVSRGIISNYRNERGLRFVQSDVMVHKGNSGGPMFDAKGNVIAITVAGLSGGSGDSLGLNFFIPIADALGFLGIEQKS